jgi:hypothetical protein
MWLTVGLLIDLTLGWFPAGHTHLIPAVVTAKSSANTVERAFSTTIANVNAALVDRADDVPRAVIAGLSSQKSPDQRWHVPFNGEPDPTPEQKPPP